MKILSLYLGHNCAAGMSIDGEPDASDWKDTINTVMKSDLSYLILENYLLEKIK